MMASCRRCYRIIMKGITITIMMVTASILFATTNHHARAAEPGGSSSSSSTSASSGKDLLPRRRRRLQQQKEDPFLSYTPMTSVTDQAEIDLDIKALRAQVNSGTTDGMANGFRIYTEGAFSGAYAELTLRSSSPNTIPAGTAVVGSSRQTAAAAARQDDISTITIVTGTTIRPIQTGDTRLLVSYDHPPDHDQQSSQARYFYYYDTCNVASLCFASDGGVVEIDGVRYQYQKSSNKNTQTIQRLNSLAQTTMFQCQSPYECPYETYNKFYNYYGVFDYANRWILSAFDGSFTSFSNGNAPFDGYGTQGKAAAITTGAVLLSAWMQVIAKMERAVDLCAGGGCQTGGFADCVGSGTANPWDEAVALYVGSQPRSSHWQDGYLLFSYAQQQCQVFGTCQEDRMLRGIARVNQAILNQFNAGQQYLDFSNCAAARKTTTAITSLMTIPLVQGTLSLAYTLGQKEEEEEGGRTEQLEAEGATTVASILPLIHACDAEDAEILYNNLRVGNTIEGGGGTDFETVKTTLERNYECLGIRCKDVGGLVTGYIYPAYIESAGPCVDEHDNNDNDDPKTTATTEETIPTTPAPTPAPKVSRNVVCQVDSTEFDELLCLGDCLPGACCFYDNDNDNDNNNNNSTNTTTSACSIGIDCSQYEVCIVVESAILDEEQHVGLDCESQQNIFSHCDDTGEEDYENEWLSTLDGEEEYESEWLDTLGGESKDPPPQGTIVDVSAEETTSAPSMATATCWTIPTNFVALYVFPLLLALFW